MPGLNCEKLSCVEQKYVEDKLCQSRNVKSRNIQTKICENEVSQAKNGHRPFVVLHQEKLEKKKSRLEKRLLYFLSIVPHEKTVKKNILLPYSS